MTTLRLGAIGPTVSAFIITVISASALAQTTAPRGSSVFTDAPFGVPSATKGKDARAAIPSAAEVAANAKLSRQLFQKDYEDTSEQGRASLARKLVEQARETLDDSAARYVLLDEAREIYIELEDLPSALDVIKQIAVSYQIDALDADFKAIQTIGQRTHQPENIQNVLSAGFELADEAIALDRPDVAQKLLVSLNVVASSTGKPDLISACRQQSTELQQRIKYLQVVADARKKLRQNPADPEMNLVVGRYECFVNKNWDAGLRLLQVSSDPALKQLAADDISSPPNSETRFDLAGSWWDWASHQTGRTQQAAQERSRYWYRLAMPQLAGLKKAIAQQRVASTPADTNKVLLGDFDTASSIIFLCDSSGSMIEKLPTLKAEIEKRVNRLRDSQRFDVAFFSGTERKPEALWAACMPADATHKSGLMQFLNTITAAGSTDPTQAIDWAMKQKPRLIILFTDGDFPDSGKTLTQLKELNRGHQVTISTVAIVNGRDKATEASFAATLKQIAKDHSGTYEQIQLQNR